MKSFWIILMSVAAQWVYAEAPVTHITVFSSGPVLAPSIPNAAITVINVREGDEINEQAPKFAYDPSDPNGQDKTAQRVKAWALSPAGIAHRTRLRNAWRAVETLYKCGIQKLPAVAFEGCTYVVYGTQDVAKALMDFDEFKKRQKSHLRDGQ